MPLGWQRWQLYHSNSFLQWGLILTQKYLHGEGEESLPLSYVAPVLSAKARGALLGIFHLETSMSLALRSMGSLTGSKIQKDFFTEGFLWSISQVFYFSDCLSKAGNTKEPLVLLVAQRLAGNTAASGITSRVWTQSLQHHLSCLSSGNSISAGSCWKLFSTFKK